MVQTKSEVSNAANTSVLAIVLAGGQGTRFWPMSRASLPKQFLSISDSGESLIQATVRRIEPLVGKEGVRVVAHAGLSALIAEHVPNAKLLVEPMARNTAACIGLAAVSALAERRGDPVLVVLPADHAVKDEESLRRALREGIAEAQRSDVLVTIGIPPTTPHTGYGYIKRGAPVRGRTFQVERFFEKPSVERAKKYLEGGDYWWNSGMFVWRASVILEAFKAYLPSMYAGLQSIAAVLERYKHAGCNESAYGNQLESEIASLFSGFEAISIDFGVLEHARNCVIIESEPFGWNDVGSWDQWADNFQCDTQGNLVKGDAIAIDSTGCVVKSDRRLIAAVGLKDVVIIDSGDALLVVSREHVQDVRKVVDELKRIGRSELV